jgi:uncharacterized membrane protein YqjE
MTHSPPRVAPPRADLSTAELVRLASAQVSALVRDEVRLARIEMASKAREAGLGAGLLGVAGVLAAYGLGALLVSVGLLLALVLPGWLAALIVTVAIFALAGLLALLGRSRLRRATPPTPVDAIAGLRADVNEVSGAVQHARDASVASPASSVSPADVSRSRFNKTRTSWGRPRSPNGGPPAGEGRPAGGGRLTGGGRP